MEDNIYLKLTNFFRVICFFLYLLNSNKIWFNNFQICAICFCFGKSTSVFLFVCMYKEMSKKFLSNINIVILIGRFLLSSLLLLCCLDFLNKRGRNYQCSPKLLVYSFSLMLPWGQFMWLALANEVWVNVRCYFCIEAFRN